MPKAKLLNVNQGSKGTPDWLARAMDPKTPLYKGTSTIQTASSEFDGKEILYPTIRMIDGQLKKLSSREAFNEAIKKNDYLTYENAAQATQASKAISELIKERRGM